MSCTSGCTRPLATTLMATILVTRAGGIRTIQWMASMSFVGIATSMSTYLYSVETLCQRARTVQPLCRSTRPGTFLCLSASGVDLHSRWNVDVMPSVVPTNRLCLRQISSQALVEIIGPALYTLRNYTHHVVWSRLPRSWLHPHYPPDAPQSETINNHNIVILSYGGQPTKGTNR